MYIWLFSRSEGAGKATTRKTRGLTRSVIARMVPPLPAASRPSNTTITRRPLYLTQSCSLQSSAWSFFSSFSYSLRFNLSLPFSLSFFAIEELLPERQISLVDKSGDGYWQKKQRSFPNSRGRAILCVRLVQFHAKARGLVVRFDIFFRHPSNVSVPQRREVRRTDFYAGFVELVLDVPMQI